MTEMRNQYVTYFKKLAKAEHFSVTDHYDGTCMITFAILIGSGPSMVSLFDRIQAICNAVGKAKEENERQKAEEAV